MQNGGSPTAKDASSWVMLLGILQIGRGRHTIAIIQIDKMDTTTLDLMDVKDIITVTFKEVYMLHKVER